MFHNNMCRNRPVTSSQRYSRGKFALHSVNSDSSKAFVKKSLGRPKPRNPIKRDRIPKELHKKRGLESILGVNTKVLSKQLASLKQDFQTYGEKDPFKIKFKNVATSQDI